MGSKTSPSGTLAHRQPADAPCGVFILKPLQSGEKPGDYVALLLSRCDAGDKSIQERIDEAFTADTHRFIWCTRVVAFLLKFRFVAKFFEPAY